MENEEVITTEDELKGILERLQGLLGYCEVLIIMPGHVWLGTKREEARATGIEAVSSLLERR